MPFKAETVVGGQHYANPFIGGMGPTAQVPLDISLFTATGLVDAYGFIKAGAPVALAAGKLGPVGAAPAFVYGVVPEAVPLNVTVPATDATIAAETGDHDIAVCIDGYVNRDIIVSNLGRALTANEIAGFAAAGSMIRLSET